MVNILGTEYEVLWKTETEDEEIKERDGYTDFSNKVICIRSESDEYIQKKTIRHEVIHAFLYESGLDENTFTVSMWARNEEMVDWFAIQAPKIVQVCQELNAL